VHLPAARAVAALLLLLATACGQTATETATGTATQTGTAPRTATETAAQVEPASYDEVAATYDQARERTLADGRAAVETLLAGDVDALHQQAAPPFAQQVTVDDLRALVAQLGQVGPRTAELAVPGSYTAEHGGASATIAFGVQFDRDGALAGLSALPRQQLPEPAGAEAEPVRVRLPFDGLWWVFWGGPTELQNYHAAVPDQRYALDLVVWRDGATHSGQGTDNADYWAWGRPVLAPADATVVAAVDGVRDNVPQQQVENAEDPAGNHVVLDLGEGRYLVLAHLQEGSVAVEKGDRVAAGGRLGLCGNSGNSSEPHVHVHAQDRPELFGEAVGLPLSFAATEVNGSEVPDDSPVRGDFVRAS
jgi:murein DD-endopeptidase MepM/ murein hydrolase activator NlpD